MDRSEMVVLAGGIVAIAVVLVYFFGPRRSVAASLSAAGVQEINITVKGGYSPDVIVVNQDQPVRLNFYRDETASCSEQVVFGDLGIARDLPAYKTTTIEFTPRAPGEHIFTCGMHMMRGKLIVNAGDPEGAYREAIEVAGAHQWSYGREAAGVMAAAVAEALRPARSARSSAVRRRDDRRSARSVP